MQPQQEHFSSLASRLLPKTLQSPICKGSVNAGYGRANQALFGLVVSSLGVQEVGVKSLLEGTEPVPVILLSLHFSPARLQRHDIHDKSLEDCVLCLTRQLSFLLKLSTSRCQSRDSCRIHPVTTQPLLWNSGTQPSQHRQHAESALNLLSAHPLSRNSLLRALHHIRCDNMVVATHTPTPCEHLNACCIRAATPCGAPHRLPYEEGLWHPSYIA